MVLLLLLLLGCYLVLQALLLQQQVLQGLLLLLQMLGSLLLLHVGRQVVQECPAATCLLLLPRPHALAWLLQAASWAWQGQLRSADLHLNHRSLLLHLLMQRHRRRRTQWGELLCW
jgi:hypothetical protein